MIRIATAAAFSELAGRILSANLELLPLVAGRVCGGVCASPAFVSARLPSRPLAASGGTHPFRALRFVRDDALFRRTLVMWMLMGFANLMILPLRVEYLANPKHGVTWGGQLLTTAQIALLVGVIPNLARLVMSPVWGWLFDRMNFFVLRIVLNCRLRAGHVVVLWRQPSGLADRGRDHLRHLQWGRRRGVGFVGDEIRAAGAGGGLHERPYLFHRPARRARAGGGVSTGRQYWSVAAISWLGAGMIVAATLLLIPEIKFGRNARPAAALTEDVSE